MRMMKMMNQCAAMMDSADGEDSARERAGIVMGAVEQAR